MAHPKRVAIIGAGPSGLTAIKSCIEEGFVPVCFEKNRGLGGLWRYEDIEEVASVMQTTITNSSKELSAFSDFPPSKELSNYMHHSKMLEYLMLYAETFNLSQYIRYHFEVVKIEKSKDYESTGSWIVIYKNTQTKVISEEEFDGIMACPGHHVYPNNTIFPGQEKFKGTILHSCKIKTCQRFAGQSVVVVGIGNSGADVAVDCAFVADKVYLSTKNGSWILGRLGEGGKPFDLNFSLRKNLLIGKFTSYDSRCKLFENKLNEKFDHEVYNVKPHHRIFSAAPTMNDGLPACILNGKIIIKTDIKRFEEDGIVFVGEESITKIDSVIFATGYEIKFPFIDSSVASFVNNSVHLYKYSIPPNLKYPNLAFIGLIQPLGPLFPVAEMQCRWFAQIMAGKLQLPTKEVMKKDIENKIRTNKARYVNSTRHTIQVDWITFMDELSEMIGAKPNLLKLAVTDPKLFWFCFNEPCFPYQYRLQGPHAWSGAREAILTYKVRVYAPLNSSGKEICGEKNGFFSNKKLFILLVVFAVYVIYWNHFM